MTIWIAQQLNRDHYGLRLSWVDITIACIGNDICLVGTEEIWLWISDFWRSGRARSVDILKRLPWGAFVLFLCNYLMIQMDTKYSQIHYIWVHFVVPCQINGQHPDFFFFRRFFSFSTMLDICCVGDCTCCNLSRSVSITFLAISTNILVTLVPVLLLVSYNGILCMALNSIYSLRDTSHKSSGQSVLFAHKRAKHSWGAFILTSVIHCVNDWKDSLRFTSKVITTPCALL